MFFHGHQHSFIHSLSHAVQTTACSKQTGRDDPAQFAHVSQEKSSFEFFETAAAAAAAEMWGCRPHFAYATTESLLRLASDVTTTLAAGVLCTRPHSCGLQYRSFGQNGLCRWCRRNSVETWNIDSPQVKCRIVEAGKSSSNQFITYALRSSHTDHESLPAVPPWAGPRMAPAGRTDSARTSLSARMHVTETKSKHASQTEPSAGEIEGIGPRKGSCSLEAIG
jgi:hypothetical protein